MLTVIMEGIIMRGSLLFVKLNFLSLIFSFFISGAFGRVLKGTLNSIGPNKKINKVQVAVKTLKSESHNYSYI